MGLPWLFAYTSCMANGQALAGVNANSIFYNATTVIGTLAGRHGLAALVALLCSARFFWVDPCAFFLP